MRNQARNLIFSAQRHAADCLIRADELQAQGQHEAAGAMRRASCQLTLAAYLAEQSIAPVLYPPEVKTSCPLCSFLSSISSRTG